MGSVTESVEVAVPVRTAYRQWTQFKEFPQFMEGVTEVRELSETLTHWVTDIGGVHREFDAMLVEQVPNERLAWTTIEGVKQAGLVTFHQLDDEHSRVTAQMDFEPEGVAEHAADTLGLLRRTVKDNLDRFRDFVEKRDHTTDGWQGYQP